LLGSWKYVSVKIIQSYSVFQALSNGVLFTESSGSQKFDPIDMLYNWSVTKKILFYYIFVEIMGLNVVKVENKECCINFQQTHLPHLIIQETVMASTVIKRNLWNIRWDNKSIYIFLN